jgi:type II secretory pathway pseudopilin PulG
MMCQDLARRQGKSLIEILIVVGIIALLVGLLLPAIQQVRTTAALLKSKNNLKQFGLAIQQYHDVNHRMPGVKNASQSTPLDQMYIMNTDADMNVDRSPFLVILPYMGVLPQLKDYYAYSLAAPDVKMFFDSADPSLKLKFIKHAAYTGNSSYGFNYHACEGWPKLESGFSDGTSNTIAIVQRYNCSYSSYSLQRNPFDVDDTTQTTSGYAEPLGREDEYDTVRRASFADAGNRDVVPKTTIIDGKPQTIPSVPGQTFQVKPTLLDAWTSIPQTPYSAGLPALCFDGSVRVISPGVRSEVFWGAVTRQGGEVLTDW